MLLITIGCECGLGIIVLSKGKLCVIEIGEMGRKYWVLLVKLLVKIG